MQATTGNARTHYDAVYTLLDNTLPVPVGDGQAPSSLPHVILYALRGGSIDGTLGAPYIDLVMPFQVSCVSRRRDQAQWLQYEVRDVLLSQTLVIPKRGVIQVFIDDPSGIERDDVLGEAEGQVFYSTDVFHVATGPE